MEMEILYICPGLMAGVGWMMMAMRAFPGVTIYPELLLSRYIV